MSISNFMFQMFEIGCIKFMTEKKSKGFITSSECTVMPSIFTLWWTINLIYSFKKKSKRNLMRKKKVKVKKISKKQREIFKLFPSSAKSLKMRRDAYVSHPSFIAGFVDKRRRKVAGNPFEEINGFPQIDVAVESQR